MEKGLNSIDDISFDNIPKVLEEDGRDSKRARGFMGSQLKHSVLYLLICDRSIQTAYLLIK